MQTSNPSRNASYPSLLQSLLDHAFLGARPASAGAAPTGSDIPGAHAAPGIDELPETDDTDADDTTGADESAGRLELAELLGVLRDPIEWVFTLAERRAAGDPVDIAAIHRVRDAALRRVNAIIVGVPPAEAPRIRTADLWTVSSLLIDAIDPKLIDRVMRGIGTRVADVVSAGLPFDPSLAAHLGPASAPTIGADVPPFAPSWYGVPAAHPFAPSWPGAALRHLGGPYLGLCPGCLAAIRALRPVVPPWCCSQSPISF